MRIGINIPNELMKRLEPLKPGLNISQVCREALEAKALCHERMLVQVASDDVTPSINRLWDHEKQFREVIAVNWEELGYGDAACWVKRAELRHWRHLHSSQNEHVERGDPRWLAWPPRIHGTKSFMDRRGEFDSRLDQQSDEFLDWLYDEHGGIDYTAFEKEYEIAWMAYTDEVWKLFMRKREEYFQELHRERLAKLEGRPEPDVPDVLLKELV